MLVATSETNAEKTVVSTKKDFPNEIREILFYLQKLVIALKIMLAVIEISDVIQRFTEALVVNHFSFP